VNTPAPNEALRDLASLLGDAATREIVQLFLGDFPDSIRSLGRCSRDDQLRIVHGLRNSALHMGAEGLSARLGDLEDRLATPGDPLASAEFEASMADFEAFAADLRRYAAP
jgi:hypothetical protein